MGRRLVVAGAGQDEARLRALAGPGIEFRGWVDDDEMARLLAGARALLFPGEEDFGILPVEAMASGCPVIALARGGALETVGLRAPAEVLERARAGVERVPGGVLFGAQTVEGLTRAMAVLEAASFDPADVRANAEPFAEEVFDRAFAAALARAHAAWRTAR